MKTNTFSALVACDPLQGKMFLYLCQVAISRYG